ncbi:MAG: hypothetical protein ABIW76_03340 [Fibrobacteria bacterium]
MYSEKLQLALEDDLSGLPDTAPVFGTRPWLEATRKALPFPLKVLKVYKGDGLAAYLPLQLIRKGGIVKGFVPILTFYGGPYFTTQSRKYFNEDVKERYEILAGILDYLGREFHYSLLLPETCDARVALEKKWRCTPRYTVINMLKSADSLEFNRACSKSIRKAERLGLTFGETVGDGAFEEAYARTFRRKGIAMSWQPRWAAGLRRELTGSGLLDHLSVRTAEGGEIAFASVALDHFRKSAILWYSCSLAEADQTGAMHFLIKNLLLRYREKFETFDLCGADHRSLSEFKEKFGQKLEVRFALEKYRGPFSEALIRSYAWVRGAAG